MTGPSQPPLGHSPMPARQRAALWLYAVAVAMLLWVACAPRSHAGESLPIRTGHAIASLLTYSNTAMPNAPLRVGLRLQLDRGWHTYWRNPGDAGDPATITVTASGALAGTTQTILWPTPTRIREGSLISYAYTGDTLLPLRLPLAAAAPNPAEGGLTTLNAHASWLVCAQSCVPEEADFTLDIKTGPQQPSIQAPLFDTVARFSPHPSPYPATISPTGTLTLLGPELGPHAVMDAWFLPQDRGQITEATPQAPTIRQGRVILHLHPAADFPQGKALDGLVVLKDPAGSEEALSIHAQPVAATPEDTFSAAGFAKLLAFGFVGGLLLNLMPCVFPILAMKALALVRLGGAELRTQRHAALGYGGGVLAGFVLLGGLIMGLRFVGDGIGWGFQLQSPLFVAMVCWLLFGMALNLLDVFTFTGPALSLPTHRSGPWHDILTGLLAVVVASPCTGPFMGVAMAGALSGPPVAGLAIFAALGAGLAAPFVVLAYAPRLAATLPRPGAWMVYVRQFLAFPLLGSCVWLLWVATLEGSGATTLLVASGLLLLGLAAWLYGLAQRLQATQGSSRGNTTLRGLALLVMLGAFSLLPALRHQSAPPVASLGGMAQHAGVEAFSQSRLEALHNAGKPVFIDMTAAWCITCLINERVALDTPATQAAFARDGVTLLRGDWTRHDPAITTFLRQHGRDGVPFYLFVPAHGAEVTLPQLLTPALVIQAISPPTLDREP